MRTSQHVIGVIPARYESTRLARKLVRMLGNKPLLQWTWENASQARLLDELVIACDHDDLRVCAERFGARAVMTSTKHSSGTDRIAEAVRDVDAAIVLNIQADEPFIHPAIIDALVQEMLSNSSCAMATVKKELTNETDIANPNIVKVICDKDGYALYFSRHAIPFRRDPAQNVSYFKHLGIYAYTKDFLFTFKNLPASALEAAEKLEQLRALEAGHRIKVIETKFDSWGVDTQEDLDSLQLRLHQNRTQAPTS